MTTDLFEHYGNYFGIEDEVIERARERFADAVRASECDEVNSLRVFAHLYYSLNGNPPFRIESEKNSLDEF